jgi:hypothetical protein
MGSEYYTFRLYTHKGGQPRERGHWCATEEEARNQLVGMVYAMFFDYKRPQGELWHDGKLVTSIR